MNLGRVIRGVLTMPHPVMQDQWGQQAEGRTPVLPGLYNHPIGGPARAPRQRQNSDRAKRGGQGGQNLGQAVGLLDQRHISLGRAAFGRDW